MGLPKSSPGGGEGDRQRKLVVEGIHPKRYRLRNLPLH